MARKKPTNPFYVLLVLVGIAFAVTACAYGVMTLRQSRASAATRSDDQQRPAWRLVDQYGAWILAGELALLAVFTFGAIATDQYWAEKVTRRDADSARQAESS